MSALGRSDAFSVVGGMPAARFIEGKISRVAGTQAFVIAPGFDAGLEFGPVVYSGPTPIVGAFCVVAIMTGTTRAYLVQHDAAMVAPTFSATPPISPADGQEWILPAGNGVLWRFRYNAASASAYKWEFVGGAPLYDEQRPQGVVSTTTYAAASNAGPVLVLPRAGDYIVAIGMNCYNNNATAQTVAMSFDIGATPATTGYEIDSYTPGGGGPGRANYARTHRHDGLGAVTLTSKYRNSLGTADAYAFDRWMTAHPVRVI